MKTWVILAIGAVALYQVAKQYNINSVEKLRKALKPYMKELMPQLEKMVPNFKKVLVS